MHSIATLNKCMEIYSSYQSSTGTSEVREVLISPPVTWILAGLYIRLKILILVEVLAY